MFMGIFDFLFPPRCISCEAYGYYLCAGCRGHIPYANLLICPKCARVSLRGETHKECKAGFFLDGLFYPAFFDGVVKKGIKSIKYRGRHASAFELATILWGNLPLFLKDFDYIIPVPLFTKRQQERGFNQSLIFGRVLSGILKVPCVDILLRTKDTISQAELSRRERKVNIENAFRLKGGFDPYNRTFIITDDVATTGETLSQCARVLKKKGAGKIWGVTLAHG